MTTRPSATQDHYHVDVFCGEAARYLRGPVLEREGGLYRIRDDLGCLAAPPPPTSLPLAEALRVALVLLRSRAELPIVPVWNCAPWELLGYRPPGEQLKMADLLRRRRRAELLRRWRRGNSVGPDGRPEPRVEED